MVGLIWHAHIASADWHALSSTNPNWLRPQTGRLTCESCVVIGVRDKRSLSKHSLKNPDVCAAIGSGHLRAR
jgi:hypothetical protein